MELDGAGLEREVEEKVQHVLKGVSETLEKYVKERNLSIVEAKELLESLEPSFKIITKKWGLLILYTLLLMGPSSFSKLHEVTGVNKRSLSTRLKELEKGGFIKRTVRTEPPISTHYTLTQTGRDTALLMIPLIYYVSKKMPLHEF
ncbi:MAG: winged helix-turn-helix transcriptional regulator [Infirmifilum sp.]|jgi:DNA-binding HxlR family transcriptional regulator|uniref:winged helix-turn-helix transcriptional regulator n=1 Tax=Infirmifilum TaxID=2856573 RepID=UPI000699C414|nr:winged helix-turn-helix transcriptional regulator [Infirmifilum uzonense]